LGAFADKKNKEREKRMRILKKERANGHKNGILEHKKGRTPPRTPFWTKRTEEHKKEFAFLNSPNKRTIVRVQNGVRNVEKNAAQPCI
jgi:hypothetical protein